MMNNIQAALFDWNLRNALTKYEARIHYLLSFVLLISGYFFFPAFYLTVAYVFQTGHRRNLDLFGDGFYSGQRIVWVWFAMVGLVCIPLVGLPIYLWMMCNWERVQLKDLIGKLFEQAELI